MKIIYYLSNSEFFKKNKRINKRIFIIFMRKEKENFRLK